MSATEIRREQIETNIVLLRKIIDRMKSALATADSQIANTA